MAALPAASGASGAVPKLSIGQVLQRLAAEHPELSPSKIRFLEEQGLVHPARTEKGYRKFSNSDVQRIRMVLSLQRDHYLPLKVIGQYLDAVDRGEHPAIPGAAAASGSDETTASTSFGILDTELELRRDELLRRSGASRDLLEAAHSAGLIPRAVRYGDDELQLLTTLVELEQAGIQPRHLRPYRTAMQHDLGLIERAVVPIKQGRDAQARARADRRAAELAGALERVRTALIRKGLRDRRGH